MHRTVAFILTLTAAVALAGCADPSDRPAAVGGTPTTAVDPRTSPYPSEPTEGVLEEPQEWTQLPASSLNGSLARTAAVQVSATSSTSYVRLQLADTSGTAKAVTGILNQLLTDAAAGTVVGRPLVGNLEVVGYFAPRTRIPGVDGQQAFTARWSTDTLAGLRVEDGKFISGHTTGDAAATADTFDVHQALHLRGHRDR